MTNNNNRAANVTTLHGTSLPSRPTHWGGREIPPIIAAWFDQLMDNVGIINAVSGSRYVDVTLTAASGGGYAKPPIITIK